MVFRKQNLIYLIIILIIYCLFIFLKPYEYKKLTPIIPLESTISIDWPSADQEALQYLKVLVSIPTIRTDENKVTEYVASILKKEGIATKLITHPEKKEKVSLIAEIGPSDSKEGLILLSHSDVVEVNKDKWLFSPFESKEIDGKIYGRGTIDMKGMMAMELVTFLNLYRSKMPLKQKIMLLIVPDEESGGDYGAYYLTQKHSQLFNGYKYVLNEGGIGIKDFPKPGVNLFNIQTSEKGVLSLEAIAKSNSGHSSMPPRFYSTIELSHFLNELDKAFNKVHVSLQTMPFFITMGESLPFLNQFILNRISNPFFRVFALNKLESLNSTNAMIKNTVAITGLATPGWGINVMPEQAIAYINIRFLPNFKVADILKLIEPIAKKHQIQINMRESSPSTFSESNTDFFKILMGAIQKNSPQAKVTPYMSPGATDNRFFRAIGLTAYGLIPVLLTMDEVSLLHNNNEYLKIENLSLGLKILFDTVNTYVK